MKFKTLEKIINGLTVIGVLAALSITGVGFKESTRKYMPLALGTSVASTAILRGAVLYGIKKGIDKNYEDEQKQDYQI